MEKLFINGENLTLNNIYKIAHGECKFQIPLNVKTKIKKSRDIIDKVISHNETVYGVTTGFGKLSRVKIPLSSLKKLQKNLILSHSCGVGPYLSEAQVRAAMLLRANTFAKGYSGVRFELFKMLVDMVNKGVIPLVPSQGSVGASGDLAPLAHLSLVLIGKGKASYKGKVYNGAKALEKAGLKPIDLSAKEGLALINGTCIMTAILALALYESFILLKNANIISAMTLEALGGTDEHLDEFIQKVRMHPGQINTASNLRKILKGSKLIVHKKASSRVQEPYCLRCVPQVHGAVNDQLDYAMEKVTIESNSATDNPLVNPAESRVLSGGNFHGAPMALCADSLAVALSYLGSISERRTDCLLSASLNDLPMFLAKNSGINSGFMIAQYTAASLVSENKVLAHPASVDSIPTSGGFEDHVSMGTTAARKFVNILENVKNVLAIEMLCAVHALDLGRPGRCSPATKAAYKKFREYITFKETDEIISDDIKKARNILSKGIIIEAVEKETGKLT
ncbi:MAG: histidine ammonia-lyase [Armatimonadota bacterium]